VTYQTAIESLYQLYEARVPASVRARLVAFVNSADSLALLLGYIWIGIAGQIMLFGLFWLMLSLHVERIVALTLSQGTAIAAQFFLNKYFNFRAFDRTIAHQAGTYVVVTALTYIVSVVIVELSVRIFGLNALVGLLLTVPICLPIGYLGNRYLTFGPGIVRSSLAYFERMQARFRRKH
jgi:putative flippase GtrA